MLEGGEHWFHTPEQMAFLDAWISASRRIGGCHLPLKGKAYDGRFVKRPYGGKPRAVEDASPYKEIAEAFPGNSKRGTQAPFGRFN